MRKMLIQYYFRNMEGQLLAIPFFVFLFLGVFLLFEQTSFAFTSSLIVSVGIITTLFLQFYRRNEKMFAVMPIPKRAFVQATFTFLLSITCIYTALFFTLSIPLIRMQEGWSWNGWASTAGTALFIALLIVNLLLLVEHIPNQKITSLISPLLLFGLIYILFLSPLHVLRTGQLFSTGSMLATALIAAFSMTWLHYKAAIYFASTIDAP
ncbi:MAG: hypothetical protein ACI33P_06115 [Lysinibacillus sp.]